MSIRDMVQRGVLKLQYISTDEQVVDVLIKPLSRVKFEYFRDKLGIVRKDFPRKGGVTLMILWYPDHHQGNSLGFIS